MLLNQYIEETIESEKIEGLGGTADCVRVYWQGDNLVLHVIDLKYGKGVAVAAENNPQLLAYLLLWRDELADLYSFDVFRATIYQPRTAGEPDDTVDYTPEELEQFEGALLAAIDEKRSEEFCAGDWCRWCPAVAHCPHLYEITVEAAAEDFSACEEIDRWLELKRVKPAIEKLLKEIDGKLLREIMHGRSVPGYKAVEGLGHSAWIDEDETLKQLARRKVGKRIATVTKLKSPTQLKNEGYEKEIDGLFHRPNLGPKLAPVSDKREAITFTTPEEDFADSLSTEFKDAKSNQPKGEG